MTPPGSPLEVTPGRSENARRRDDMPDHRERAMAATLGPATEAGQRLDLAWPGDHLDRLHWREAILAIENEARAALLDERDALREVAQEYIDAVDAYLDAENQFTDSRANAMSRTLLALRARLDSLGGTE